MGLELQLGPLAAGYVLFWLSLDPFSLASRSDVRRIRNATSRSRRTPQAIRQPRFQSDYAAFLFAERFLNSRGDMLANFHAASMR